MPALSLYLEPRQWDLYNIALKVVSDSFHYSIKDAGYNFALKAETLLLFIEVSIDTYNKQKIHILLEKTATGRLVIICVEKWKPYYL